ncbi:polyprenyl synthetase family protein [Bacillus infantis]|uniref:polyprenyl synthetase family protein n=1 Tax=Bacillus infantis TaxID=324767 RepID=UPI0020046C34|nr:polyprenyl synthetase family protein [Bacillus infantis]MCK6207165.1 polyprenyl synthetase family protein [Bacillus infantis]
MIKETLINPEACYREAEKKAAAYFQALFAQASEKSFIPVLERDFHSWKKNHRQTSSFLPFFSRKNRKPDSKAYHSYIKWLEYRGKLDDYLDRSISYLYMRDLGKSLDDRDTKESIGRAVESLKERLTAPKQQEAEYFGMAGLYRWAEKEGIQSAVIWLMEKLQQTARNIPEGMDAAHAQRKLIKIIAGVLMHETEAMKEGIEAGERKRRLERAIRLGYSYGLTYPFIDDLLDSRVLSEDEKKQFSELIRTTLTTGSVPPLGRWQRAILPFITYVHNELREAFHYIKAQQTPETLASFLEQAYVFFQSQEVDRQKDLNDSSYTNEELYIPVILKSSSSRLIVRSVLNSGKDDGFDSRTFYYGIYNQLADDFADLFADLEDGAVTPYTYYLTHYRARHDLLNPFEVYWTVIVHLIHDVYGSNPKAREVILDRAINGLKRSKERLGKEKYREVMELFAPGSPEFSRLIQQMAAKAADVDFFDKLLRDHMLDSLQKERLGQEDFRYKVEEVQKRINNVLQIEDKDLLMGEPVREAANYSLAAGGKRLRPVIAWFVGVEAYGMEETALMPLLRSLEYMHTASLIFDDLPAQDNAPSRRGKAAVHEVYGTAAAELSGLYLTQKAMEDQASLTSSTPDAVLELIRYTARSTAEMCRGQAMDLEAKGKALTAGELDALCFYKTGIAFEASIIMPAILAGAEQDEIDVLKKFARHAGIAFQIRDDLLDVEGDPMLLGKPVGTDSRNKKETYVSALGKDGAKRSMWEHYCSAAELLQELRGEFAFLGYLLDYMVHREK